MSASSSRPSSLHRLLARGGRRSRSPNKTATTDNNDDTSNTSHSKFRQVLDVLNLILIALFLLKGYSEVKATCIAASEIVATNTEVKTQTSTDGGSSLRGAPVIEETSLTAAAITTTDAAPQAPKEQVSIATPQAVKEQVSLDTTTSTSPIPIDYKSLLNSGQQTNICILANSGLGSQMIQMMAQKIFYQDRGFQFVADDSTYGYKWDDQTGVLKGFFQPQFPVFDQGEHEKAVTGPFQMANTQQVQALSAFRKARSADSKVLVQWAINEEFRSNFQQNYKSDSPSLYNRFVSEACANLQFSPPAKAAIQSVVQDGKIPNLRQSHSVAFHVRRGDKIRLGESRMFAGAECVDKLVSLQLDRPIDDCFVASDSLEAFQEVRSALKSSNITYKFHSLATRTEELAGVQKAAYLERSSTVQFLAEMSLLLDATYFIGTFNSNVGALTSILRKCHYYGAPHYAHSYGVDRESWHHRA